MNSGKVSGTPRGLQKIPSGLPKQYIDSTCYSKTLKDKILIHTIGLKHIYFFSIPVVSLANLRLFIFSNSDIYLILHFMAKMATHKQK